MASCSSSVSNIPRYDVFLSFRGEDTRHSFTDHLYEALVQAGLRTFRDNDEIGRGQQLKPEIESAIKQSRASIVVLSERYADSRWCLDELVLILEQRQECGHFVLPVFYHVDPSDVRNQRKSFAIEEKKWPAYNVNRWKAALTQVADLTGMVLQGPETIFITKIVDTIYFELNLKLVSTPNHLTGIETRAEGINSWLKDEHSSAEVLAICGMGGSGKTTLARYIYESNKQNFESSSFLERIGERCQEPNEFIGLLGLQKQLLRDVLGGKNIDISSVCEGTRKIEGALQIKRMLIVLDDIDEHDKLAALLGTKTFHTQSRIIITSRLLDIKAWLGSISWGCQVYTMKLLNNDESLELLCCHAFGSKIPMEGFEDLALELARYCEGNPQALTVLGRSLSDTAEDRNSMIKVWRSTLDSLNSLKGDLDKNIQNVLQRSFHSLPYESHKKLFLHIAIFFVGEYEDNVVNILEHDCHAQSGIKTLINRCLVTVSPLKKLMMHQLLQEMGRAIVCKESNNPAKRSRVWHNDESSRLLTDGDGSKTIEGLALKLKEGTEPLVFETDSLVKMKKLKLLQLNFVKLTGSYKNFPKLTWLCWHGCHLKTIPSGLLSSSLVSLDMSYGSLKIFEPPMVLNSLKILNLKECHHLHSIRNMNRLPNLKTLILRGCFNLTHVCETIRGLESLVVLDLSSCLLMTPKDSCVNRVLVEPLFPIPRSLEILYLDHCYMYPKNISGFTILTESLRFISLAGNFFEFLPRNIEFTKLVVLDLTGCLELKSLLCLPSTLKELYTGLCKSLEKITFQSPRFRLQNFVYDDCPKLSEVEGLFKLVPISKLDEADLGDMQWIKAYQDHKVDLKIENINKGRNCNIQMLYEYGIRSTYLKGIKDQSMTTSEYTTPCSFLTLHVPLCPKKRRIQGLNVTIIYRSDNPNKNMWFLFLIMSNKTKGLTWVYNPLIYCKPGVDEDVVWISYWPIGNVLDPGDEVDVDIGEMYNLIGSVCGVSLVYNFTDVEIEQENNTEEEIIGGDLSEFEVAPGKYFLCRHPFVKSEFLKMFFGDNICYTDLEGWKKSFQSNYLQSSWKRKSYNNTHLKDIWLGGFTTETEIPKIKKVVSRLPGVEFVKYDTKTKLLLVSGHVNRKTVVTCVREVDNMVEMADFSYKAYELRHHDLLDMISIRCLAFSYMLIAGLSLWYVWWLGIMEHIIKDVTIESLVCMLVLLSSSWFILYRYMTRRLYQ